jgi:short subunit dehydrogenase-like uncharacterized protein
MRKLGTRPYDVILYGASGFTGRQTVEYFAKHAPHGLRWAIAGRNRDRLERVRAAIGAPVRAEDVLVGDSRDQNSVDDIVSRTRILLSTAGPFALYGTPIVDACARLGTHYVDITGETFWVRDLVERYQDRAAADGIRIVPCCGFDSVPSDLGSFLLVRHMQQMFGSERAEVRNYFRIYGGGLNGGTAASFLNIIKTRRARKSISRDTLPPPHYDEVIGAWVGPFFMAPVNTWVVRRSAALYAESGDPYPPDFMYREFLKFDPPLAAAKAVLVTSGLALVTAAARQPLTRSLVAALLPKAGTGPSVRRMDRGGFTCELIGLARDGLHARGLIRHAGDAGNRATVRMLAESALALALDFDTLPGGPQRGGVLTPATAFGHVLADRLRRTGMTLEITPT